MIAALLAARGDGDDEFALYSSDILDDVCGSDGDPTLSSALAEDPTSPPLSDDEASPQEPLSFQHSSIFLSQEDLTIPLDFELRESAVASGGLGIWSRRRVSVGERFGPYVGEHRPCLRDPTQGWEAVLWPLPFPPSHFMTGIVMSLEFWAASDWAMQCFSLALSDIGTRSNCHPGHRAINHAAGIGLHFLNSYQFLQGTKRPLWALGSKNVSSL
eukprot:superscaffoldBa00000140_g2022